MCTNLHLHIFFYNSLPLCRLISRLRVIRDYRSPRAIRSFNKVFTFVLMFALAPYFVHLGTHNPLIPWQPYYLSVILALVFSTLQGVQDKLDDPFDGMGEDDIKLESTDEWPEELLENINPNTY